MTAAADRLSVRLVRPLAMGMRMGGRDDDALLRRAGLDPAIIEDGNAWIPMQAALDCWTYVDDGPPYFGLRLAAGIDFTFAASLESVTEYLLVQLLITSATVGEALDNLQRYAAVTFGRFRFEVEQDASGALVRFAGREARTLPKELVNFSLAFPLRAMFVLASRRVAPTDVFLPYPTPPSLDVHEQVFGGARLHFSASSAAYRVAAGDLGVPLNGVNPKIWPLLRARAEELLQERSGAGDFLTKARSLIQESLREGRTTVPLIARRAGVSPRILARRLAEQGTSYRTLVDEMRRDRADELLRDARLAPSELAAALGLDTRTLQRALRRWSLQSPRPVRPASRRTRSH